MSQRLSEFFAREASEYLVELERHLTAPDAPDAGELLRLTRGVRGSAEMAGVRTLARVAGRLEDAVRSLQSGDVRWSEELRGLALDTVHDLQLVLGALGRWGPEEEARLRGALRRWDGPAADPEDAVPVSTLFFDDAGPHVIPSPADGDAVPVESLLLRGDAALREALGLRAELEAALDASSAGDRVRALVRELFELVELGSAREPVAG